MHKGAEELHGWKTKNTFERIRMYLNKKNYDDDDDDDDKTQRSD